MESSVGGPEKVFFGEIDARVSQDVVRHGDVDEEQANPIR